MTRVRFSPSGFETDITAGTRLVDVTDRFPEAAVPYSCRSASCGTCRVRIQAGAEACAPAEDDELEVLEIFGSETDVRLCCQLQLEKDTETLSLEVVDPD